MIKVIPVPSIDNATICPLNQRITRICTLSNENFDAIGTTRAAVRTLETRIEWRSVAVGADERGLAAQSTAKASSSVMTKTLVGQAARGRTRTPEQAGFTNRYGSCNIASHAIRACLPLLQTTNGFKTRLLGTFTWHN